VKTDQADTASETHSVADSICERVPVATYRGSDGEASVATSLLPRVGSYSAPHRSRIVQSDHPADGDYTCVRPCGIVLAGVYAWGNSALERLCPRPLLPVAGLPIISYGLRWLEQSGVRQTTVCVNSDPGPFRRRLAGCGLQRMDLCYHQDEMPRGPAGCVRDAALRTNAESFVVLDASAGVLVDLSTLLAAHGE
jgi:hypothetical protein